MKKVSVFIFCFLISIFAIGQIDSSENYKFPFEERMPLFLPDCDVGVMKLISDSLVYPKLAIKDKIKGKVVVKFAIDTNGLVTGFKNREKSKE
jgi:hypothetical protein